MSEKPLLLVGTEEQCGPQSKDQKLCSRTLQEENRSGSRIFENRNLHQGEIENNKGQARSDEENRASRNSKVREGWFGSDLHAL